MNLHQHAWPLYTLAKQLGVEFHETGVRLRPALPLEEYDFHSSLLGWRKSKGGYSGWYAPLAAGAWEVAIELPNLERQKFGRIWINGVPQSLAEDGGVIHFRGESRPGHPLQWELRPA
jgi:hypothetical protein